MVWRAPKRSSSFQVEGTPDIRKYFGSGFELVWSFDRCSLGLAARTPLLVVVRLELGGFEQSNSCLRFSFPDWDLVFVSVASCLELDWTLCEALPWEILPDLRVRGVGDCWSKGGAERRRREEIAFGEGNSFGWRKFVRSEGIMRDNLLMRKRLNTSSECAAWTLINMYVEWQLKLRWRGSSTTKMNYIGKISTSFQTVVGSGCGEQHMVQHQIWYPPCKTN
jgi:hypothetical protein